MEVSILICGLAFLWSGFSHKSEVATVMSNSSWDTFLPRVDAEETDNDMVAATKKLLKDVNLPTPSLAEEIRLHNSSADAMDLGAGRRGWDECVLGGFASALTLRPQPPSLHSKGPLP